MRIKFTYYNAKKMTLISEIDGVEAGCRISGSEPTACVELDVPTGQHVLTVTKRTWYDLPLCFLNIINPIFYLWQLKFFDHRDLYNSERFSSVAVSFDVNENPENALMVLKLEPNGAAESTEMLCSAVHTENVDVRSISKAKSRRDLRRISRFKRTHLLSVIFYTVLSIVFTAVEIFLRQGNVIGHLVFCGLILLLSGNMLYRIYKR